MSRYASNPCLTRLAPGNNPFDIHVYFSSETREKAMAFRTALSQKFPWLRVHEPWDKPIGPHPERMWEADFGTPERAAQYVEVAQWLEENHNGLSILFHPNTGDGHTKSHTEPYAVWYGEKLPLKFEIFGGN